MDGTRIRFQIRWLNSEKGLISIDRINTIDLTAAISTACWRLKHNRCPNTAVGFIVKRGKDDT